MVGDVAAGVPRVLFYSHDGCGLGHLRRQLTIAGTLAQQAPGAAVLVATGIGEWAPFSVPPTVDILKIPGLRKVANDYYVAGRMALRADDATELRAGLLAAAVRHFRPSVLLVDKHPLGPAGSCCRRSSSCTGTAAGRCWACGMCSTIRRSSTSSGVRAT
jgi:predicted glycosyltransferase